MSIRTRWGGDATFDVTTTTSSLGPLSEGGNNKQTGDEFLTKVKWQQNSCREVCWQFVFSNYLHIWERTHTSELTWITSFETGGEGLGRGRGFPSEMIVQLMIAFVFQPTSRRSAEWTTALLQNLQFIVISMENLQEIFFRGKKKRKSSFQLHEKQSSSIGSQRKVWF